MTARSQQTQPQAQPPTPGPGAPRRRGSRRSDRALIHDTARVRQGPALLVGALIGVLLVLALVLAVVQNDESVRFEWTALDVDAPLWALLLGAFATGAVFWAVSREVIRKAAEHNTRRHAAAEELGRRGRGRSARTSA